MADSVVIGTIVYRLDGRRLIQGVARELEKKLENKEMVTYVVVESLTGEHEYRVLLSDIMSRSEAEAARRS